MKEEDNTQSRKRMDMSMNCSKEMMSLGEGDLNELDDPRIHISIAIKKKTGGKEASKEVGEEKRRYYWQLDRWRLR